MSLTAAIIALIVGLLMSTFAATAAQVLHEFARHELEIYCKQRQRQSWFDAIIQQRDRLALGAEVVQMLSITVFALGLLGLFFAHQPLATASATILAAWVAVGTVLLLICNSWIPWGVVHFASAPFLFHSWRFWQIVSRLTWPLTIGVTVVSAIAGRIAGQADRSDDEEEVFEEEIRSMASEGERGGWLETHVRDMLEGVLDLDDTRVSTVMTPRGRVDSIEVSTEWERMLKYVVETERTRLPVYRQRLDNVLGILYTKDLLTELLRPAGQRRPLEKLLRKGMFVPESTRLDEMLGKFLQNRVHLAIVLDEYGAVAGIVTIEDILEEIVGEIQDETDIAEPAAIERVSANQARVSGTALIELVNQELGLDLPEVDDFDTIAGLIMSRCNDIPRRGQKIVIGNIEFEILSATPRVVEMVKLTIHDSVSLE